MQQAKERTGQPTYQVLAQLGLSEATYYRWQARRRAGSLADQVGRPGRRVPRSTPAEEERVCAYSLSYPQVGYKRLTWQMVDQDVVYLRPYQVYAILGEHDLLHRRLRTRPGSLQRPAEPDHADQVWHVDLMYLYVEPRWYYLVDILDGYSRYLVHWRLNLTMEAETITLTVQEALEGLPSCRSRKPKVVHDNGGQFFSREWRTFLEGAGLTGIRTRVAHPQSNGRLERLHRTHREEGFAAEALTDYYQALDAMAEWADYYNHQRPHSALNYLRPVDYYRGDPAARLAERERKLVAAVAARQAYWNGL